MKMSLLFVYGFFKDVFMYLRERVRDQEKGQGGEQRKRERAMRTPR